MSIHDFYSKLMSSDERNPLFHALLKLSRLQDLRTAMMAESTDQDMRDWSIWNAPGTLVVEPTEPAEPAEPMPFALARA
jgi:hypothetical protein